MADQKTDSLITKDTVKLYVGGINPEWSEQKITDILKPHGKIIRTDIVKSFAFSFAETKEDADNIIKNVSGTVHEDCTLSIQISKNKQNLIDGDNLCFECGKGGHWAKDCAQRQERNMRSRGRGRGGDRGGRGGERGRGRGGFDQGRGREGFQRGRGRGGFEHRRGRGGDRGRGRGMDRGGSGGHGGADRSYSRDPYSRDSYPERQPHARVEPYVSPRDFNGAPKDPYASRDPYARDPYARESYARDPYARPRSPLSRTSDPYAAEREKLAYGSRDPYGAPPRAQDPYASRAQDPYAARADSYAAPPRRDPYAEPARTDPYAAPPRRDPYDQAARLDPYAASTYRADPYAKQDPYAKPADYRYSTSADPADKRYPEPVTRASIEYR